MQRISLGKNSLKEACNNAAFTTSPPTTSPYTGKWVCEENPSIVLTTQQLVSNYPNATAPEGTYVWQTTSAVVSFDANGGTTTEPTIIQNGTSSAINLPRGEATTLREGYQIVAWNTERDGNGTHYYLGQKITPQQGKNLILYAQWKAIDDYPDKLVNGDFEHMDASLFSKTANSVGAIANWVECNPHSQITEQVNGGCDLPGVATELPDTVEPSKFGWRSYANELNAYYTDRGIHDGLVVHNSEHGTNRYGEITDYTIYQDVKTVPGTLYKWELQHASRDKSKKNSVCVIIGSPASPSPQVAWRTSVNGAGDVIGEVGTLIHTQNSNPESDCSDYSKQWETYTGTYIVPKGQHLTRFAFAGSGAATGAISGSRVDNITFSRAYPLYYDMNDDDSARKADRNGLYEDTQVADNGAQGYLNENEDTALTNIIPSRDGYKLIGWSLEKLDALPVDADVESVSDKLVSSVSISEATTVYAVWQKNTAPLEYVIEGKDNLDRKGIYSDPVANDEQGFHEIGSTVKLTDIKPTRAAHKFLGWSTEKIDDIAYLDDADAKAFVESDKHVTEIIMSQEGSHVYAVWQEKYSRKILNGDFGYPDDPKLMSVGSSQKVWTYVNPFKETAGSLVSMTKIPLSQLGISFDRKLFGWASTQNQKNYPFDEDGDVEIRFQSDAGYQHYADLIPSQSFAAIYQDIATEPGTICKWRLSHCSSVKHHVDTMSVVIGIPQQEGIVSPATRIKSNGSGTIGETNDIIATKVTNDDEAKHAGQWEDYTGVYVVPEGQYVTRFSFKSIEGYVNNCTGNYVDNIAFSVAYPLHFDMNGGTNKTIYDDPATNNYAGYHQEGEEVTLPTSPDNLSAPAGYELIGWSEEQLPWMDESTSLEEKASICSKVVGTTTYSMPAEEKTLYAVYAKTPSIHIDGTKGGYIEKKETTQSGFLLPSFDIEIEPDPGFRIEKILVDGKPLIDVPLSEGESFTASLDDVAGNHTVSVEFRDMRVEMSETGSEGITVLLLIGTMLVAVGSVLIARSTRGRFGERKR